MSEKIENRSEEGEKLEIAGASIYVNFTDGQEAVFSLSPGGTVEPASGDKVEASGRAWEEAANLLRAVGLKVLSEAQIKTPHGGTSWLEKEEK